jgi:chromosome segregation ATPase
MAGPNTVFSKHEAALRKLARDAQDIVRISEQACSTYLKTEQKLHEDLSGLEKKVAEGNVQIKRLEAELAQVRGELTEAKQTLRDNGVTIATLEATVREIEEQLDM